MPRISTTNAQFNPIDFATRIKPIEQYAETYNAMNSALLQDAALGDNLGSMITNTDNDAELRQIYNNYNKAIDEAVATLSSGDISKGGEQIRNITRLYSSQLQPVENAAKMRLQDINSYKEKLAKDSSYLGEDPNTRGVSEYLNGQSPVSFGVSGKEDLYTSAFVSAKAASDRFIKDDGWGLDPSLFNYYFSKSQSKGFSEQDVQEIWSYINDKNKSGRDISELRDDLIYLSNIITNTFSSTYGKYIGNNFDHNKRLKDQAGAYILSGIRDGITYDLDSKQLNYPMASGSSKDDIPTSPTVYSNTQGNRTKDNPEIDKEAEYIDTLIRDAEGNITTTDLLAYKHSNKKAFKEQVLAEAISKSNLGGVLPEYYSNNYDLEGADVQEDLENNELTIIAAPKNKYYEALQITIPISRVDKNYQNAIKVENIRRKYANLKIDGTDEISTIRLGNLLNGAKRNLARQTFSSPITNTTAANKQLLSMIALTRDNSGDPNEVLTGNAGFYNVNTYRPLSKKEVSKAKQLKESDIISISIVSPDTNKGYKPALQIITNTGLNFLMVPNNDTVKNAFNIYDSLYKESTEFLGERSKYAPILNIDSSNAYDTNRQEVEAMETSIKNFLNDAESAKNVTVIDATTGLCVVTLKEKDNNGNPEIKNCIVQVKYDGEKLDVVPIRQIPASSLIVDDGRDVTEYFKDQSGQLLNDIFNVK